VVLGAHRSGTSAMARALSLNGAVLPLRMLPAQPDNPLGFWESKDVVDINDRLLAAMDLEWSDPFLAPQARYLSNIEGGFFDEAVAALQGNFEGRSPIVLKDPRISVLNEFWGRVLVRAGYRPVYVIMVRNPIEVASSLTARNGFSRERALLIWASHMVAAVRDTAESVRVFISYDQLISDWRGALARVESATGATLPRRSATASVETDRFISVAQRHHHSEPPDGTQIWPPIVELYELALRAANGAELDRARFAAVSAHLEQLQGLLAPVFAEGQLDQKTLRAAQYIAASEASAALPLSVADSCRLCLRRFSPPQPPPPAANPCLPGNRPPSAARHTTLHLPAPIEHLASHSRSAPGSSPACTSSPSRPPAD